MFARYGVPEYWIVHPARGCIEVYRLDAGAYVLGQVAAGDDDVRSDIVRGDVLRAGSVFP